MSAVYLVVIFILGCLFNVHANTETHNNDLPKENAAQTFALSQTTQFHLSFLNSLANHQSTSIQTLKSLAFTRLESLSKLGQTSNKVDYEKALQLAGELKEEINSQRENLKDQDEALSSFNQIIETLESSQLIESYFSESVDYVRACGISAEQKFFCESTLFFHQGDKLSYLVSPLQDYGLNPSQTHRDVHLSGYLFPSMGTGILLPYSSPHLFADPSYTIPTGARVNSLGANTLLYINVQFPDLLGATGTAAQYQSIIDGTQVFFKDASYGQASIGPVTITPTLLLPKNASTYGTNYNLLASDADAAANAWLAANVASTTTVTTFNLRVWQFNHLSAFAWAGLGSVGGAGVWNNGNIPGSFGVKVICHELGHNYNMNHASAWKVTDANPLSPNGANDEYGDTFDMMGFGYGTGAHYNAFYKLNLKWITQTTETSLMSPTSTSLTTVLWPSDQISARGNLILLDVPRPNNQPIGDHYWLSTKSGGVVPPATPSVPYTVLTRDMLGLFIHTSQAGYGIPKSYLINTHPEYNSGSGVAHAALQVGETYTECAANISITNAGFNPCSATTSYSCVTATVYRTLSNAAAINIVVNIAVAQPLPLNTPVLFTVTTDAGAAVLTTLNFLGDTFSNVIAAPSASYNFTTSGYKTIIAQATDFQGRMTKFSFVIAVGKPTGTAPTIAAANSWTRTCAAGKVTGYVGTITTGTVTSVPTSAGPVSTNAPATTPTAAPAWYESGLGACSVTCGGGVSTQTVQCRSGSTVLPDTSCVNAGPKPASSIVCNTQVCDTYSWVTGAFSTCSVSCGGGVQTRTVQCQLTQIATGILGSIAPSNSLCTGAMPPATQTCNTIACVTASPSTQAPTGTTAAGNPTSASSNNYGPNTNCSTPNPSSCSCLFGYANPPVCDQPPSITVTGPASAVVAPGSSITVTWVSTGTSTGVSLLLSSTGTIVPLYIARSAPNTGSYTYTIPVNQPAGAYFITVMLLVPGNQGATVPSQQYIASTPTFTVEDSCKLIGLTCFNGGSCASGVCVCPGGFFGATCLDSVCGPIGNTSATCNNRGLCASTAAGPVCTCGGGYTGSRCEIPPGCNLNCANGGVPINGCTACDCTAANKPISIPAISSNAATSGVSSQISSFTPAWGGSMCSTCTLNTCGANGVPDSTCTQCVCNVPFHGPTCSVQYYLFTIRLILNPLSTGGDPTTASDFTNFLSNLLNDISYALGLNVNMFAVQRTVSSPGPNGKYYVYVVIRFYPSSTVTSNTIIQALTVQSINPTSTLIGGAAASFIDSNSNLLGAPVQPNDVAPTSGGNNNNGGNNNGGVPAWEIAVIVVGIVVLIAAVIGLGFLCKRRENQRTFDNNMQLSRV